MCASSPTGTPDRARVAATPAARWEVEELPTFVAPPRLRSTTAANAIDRHQRTVHQQLNATLVADRRYICRLPAMSDVFRPYG